MSTLHYIGWIRRFIIIAKFNVSYGYLWNSTTVGIWNRDYSGFWMVKKRLGCKRSGFQMGSEIRKPNPLKYGRMAAILSKTIWNPDKNVHFEWSGLWMVGTIAMAIVKAWPFEIQPSKSPDFKCQLFLFFQDIWWHSKS